MVFCFYMYSLSCIIMDWYWPKMGVETSRSLTNIFLKVFWLWKKDFFRSFYILCLTTEVVANFPLHFLTVKRRSLKCVMTSVFSSWQWFMQIPKPLPSCGAWIICKRFVCIKRKWTRQLITKNCLPYGSREWIVDVSPNYQLSTWGL